jgi:hypothetical protein
LRLKEAPRCAQISPQKLKPIAKVVACPHQPSGNEELEVSLLEDSTIPPNFVPSFYGASWRLIRKNYDPCDSGGGHGQWMCTLFSLEMAEQKLNAITRSESPITRRHWMSVRDRQCKVKGDGFSEAWAYRDEEDCKLQLTLKRISTIRARAKMK